MPPLPMPAMLPIPLIPMGIPTTPTSLFYPPPPGLIPLIPQPSQPQQQPHQASPKSQGTRPPLAPAPPSMTAALPPQPVVVVPPQPLQFVNEYPSVKAYVQAALKRKLGVNGEPAQTATAPTDASKAVNGMRIPSKRGRKPKYMKLDGINAPLKENSSTTNTTDASSGAAPKATKPAVEPKVIVLPCPHPGCPKTFNRQFNLKSHLKSHATERAYRCDACPATFRRSHDLKRHYRSLHTVAKPYECATCRKRFSRMVGIH
ncbi:hypothetical protein HK102_006924 [Quaeritorhiza haematococci]|nr:hypothetical protein HK102_006924 [Quaeritorhiza haematococci]